jgi:hypothetical protein
VGYETELFEPGCMSLLDFCSWGQTKSEVYKRKVDKRDESVARILDGAGCVTER